jgi:hypothetical protein
MGDGFHLVIADAAQCAGCEGPKPGGLHVYYKNDAMGAEEEEAAIRFCTAAGWIWRTPVGHPAKGRECIGKTLPPLLAYVLEVASRIQVP